jgi:hypothetical protein
VSCRYRYRFHRVDLVFQILVKVRPIPGLGVNGGEIRLGLLNDTGSNTMSLKQSDLNAMHITTGNYQGWTDPVPVTTANGRVTRDSLDLQVQLRKSSNAPASDWFNEPAIIIPPQDQQTDRLSGDEMRVRFYFATGPGNQHLYMAETKTALNSILPALQYQP